MDIRFDSARLSLDRHRELELTDAAGTRIVCHAGSLWITQEHDTRDIVLADGEGFVLDRPGLAIVRALQPSVLALSGRSPRLRGGALHQGSAFLGAQRAF